MKTFLTCLAFAMVAACSRPDPVADDVANADSLPTLNEVEASPTGAPPVNAEATDGEAPTPASGIPSALQGRWGLTPADCTSTKGDAKGLLIVDTGSLKFYESRAVPSPGIQTSPDSVAGNFAFTGEGQEWTKYETLERKDHKLVRTERDPVATFTYVRC